MAASDEQIVDILVGVQTEYVPKSEVARLTALLAERDAEIKGLREAGNGMADAIDAYHDRLSRSSMGQPSPMTGMQKPLILWRAALAARGGEVQG